jgi:hypothetical protein
MDRRQEVSSAMSYAIGIFLSVMIALLSVLPTVSAVIIDLTTRLPILLGVLMAAVLVRLARGLPTIPYEKVAPKEVLRATSAFRFLMRSYVHSMTVIILSLIANIIYPSLSQLIDPNYLPTLIGTLAFLNSLVLMAIYFMVSSDLKLANIQAKMTEDVSANAAKLLVDKSVSTVRDSFNTQKN